MINTIAFDLGGVVVENRTEEIQREIARIMRISVEEYREISEPLISKTLTGELSLSSYYQILSKEIRNTAYPNNKSNSGDAYMMLMTHLTIHKKVLASKNEEIVEMINEFRERYKVVSLSNIEKEIMAATQQNGIYDLFKENYRSWKMRKMKPNSDVYVHMLRDLKATPNEVVFVDDKLENAMAFRRLNGHAIHYENPTQLRRELGDYTKTPAVH